MIVDRLDATTGDGIARIVARVRMEDHDAPPFALFVEGAADLAGRLLPDPDALLTALYVPAAALGERRVRVEGSICPELASRLPAVVRTIASWQPRLAAGSGIPVIEASVGFRARVPRGRGSLLLLTCGLDSLASLRLNTLHLPPDHPGRIHSTLTVFPAKAAAADAMVLAAATADPDDRLGRVHRATGVETLRVATNLGRVLPDGYFWDEAWHGSYLAGIAALFGAEVATVLISAGAVVPSLHVWGSNPTTDPNCSSAHLRVDHYGLGLARLDKLRLLSAWPEGLAAMTVCQKPGLLRPNCGRCEKCLRTMIGLRALGRLGDGPFPERVVEPRRLRAVAPWIRKIAASYAGLTDQLDPVADAELVATLREILAEPPT